jgi:hypothetical protein
MKFSVKSFLCRHNQHVTETILWGLVFFAALSWEAKAEDMAKTLIGAMEEVILLQTGTRLPARIDTGAAMTSLDVRNLTVVNRTAQFQLPEQYGGVVISRPVIRHCSIRSANGRERRPIVEIELCVGSRRFRVQANLNDRSRMEYPLILGRDLLKQGFLVDCGREKTLSSDCAEGTVR